MRWRIVTFVHYWWDCQMVQPLRKNSLTILKMFNLQLPRGPENPVRHTESNQKQVFQQKLVHEFDNSTLTVTQRWG